MEEDALKQQPRNQKERIKLRDKVRLKAQDIINWCWDADKFGVSRSGYYAYEARKRNGLCGGKPEICPFV